MPGGVLSVDSEERYGSEDLIPAQMKRVALSGMGDMSR